MISRAVLPTRRSRTWVFLWIALFLMGILLQYGVALTRPGTAIAASGLKAGTVAGFEVDGDLKSGDGASNPGEIPSALIDGTLANGDDWLVGASGNGVVDPDDPPRSILISDPLNSNSDSQYIGGAKELDTCTWGNDNGPVTPKDDLGHVMAYAKFVGNSAFFYMGAERTVHNGDTHVDFELNRNPYKVFTGGSARPDRSIGDLIISLEYSNGGSNPELTIYQVTSVTSCGNGERVAVEDITSTAAVHSATNFVALPDAGFGYDIEEFEFAEAAIDLGALGINPSCPGISSGSIRTRAGGDIDSSQLKDRVEPFPIDLNNCGRLRIEKHAGTADGPLLGGATFTIDPNPIPGGGNDPLTITDNDSNDNNNDVGVIVINPAKPGTYEVCETVAPPGYKLPTDECDTLTLDPNGTKLFTFVDPPEIVATTLTPVQYLPSSGSFVAVGDPISLRVREANTGESILTNVHVTGTDSCANWTPQANKNAPDAGEAFTGTLDPEESVDFTCSFNAPAGSDIAWTATGRGTDERGNAAPLTNEVQSGSYDVLEPATTLTLKSIAPGTAVHAGAEMTITVNEKNSGEGTISNVNVTGVNSCLAWTPVEAGFDGELSPDESADFECTFTAPSDDFTWEADGWGTDALGDEVPTAGEHVEGAVDVVKPATVLSVVGSVPAKVPAGVSVSITVRETNTGDGPLTGVDVIEDPALLDGICDDADWVREAGQDDVLEAGQSLDFTCTFTAPADGTDVTWSALGEGFDSLNKKAPDANERQSGRIEVIAPATVLTLKSIDPGTTVHAGDAVTIVVTEANTGDDALSGVHVDGGGACATWTAAANKNDGDGIFIGALGPGESVDFTCSFTAPADGTDVTWSADGKGTDSLGTPAPTANEHQDGAIVVILPATTLTLVSEVPDPILENGTTVITVRETNVGDDTLTGVSVVNLDNVTSDCTAWVGPLGFDGILSPQESVDFSCTITAGEADVIWNALGQGTDSLGDPAPDENEDEAGTVHVVNPDIDVVKTAGATLESQVADGAVWESLDGDTVVYKYVVTTLDPDGLTNVTVEDDRCEPESYVSGDTGSDGKLVPGESWIFQCSQVLTLEGDADAKGDVTNVVTATGTTILNSTVSETDDAVVHLRHPDVTIAKDEDDADDLVFPGQVVIYTLTLTVVDGPTDLVVTDDLPAGMTYVADSASDDGTEEAGVITWNLSNVATGKKELTYQVTVSAASGTLENVATACVPAFNDFDEDCDDTKHEVRVPGLGITKAVVNDEDHVVARGQTVSYEITVTVTDGPFTDVVITDTLPDGQTLVGGTAKSSPASKITEGVEAIIWEFDRLNGTATLTYDVTIDADAPNGPQENVAVVCVAELESCDEDDVTVRVPALTILKDLTAGNTAGSDPKLGPLAKVGDVLTYTLTYTLTDGPVTEAVITDPVKPGLQYVPGSASDGGELVGDTNGNGGTVTWNLGTIEDDGEYTVTYQVKVLAGAVDQTQPIINEAIIDSAETLPDDDDATVGVNPPPSVASPTPTLPATDTTGTGGGTSGGSGLALILLLAVGILGGIGILAPAPARRRMRDRD